MAREPLVRRLPPSGLRQLGERARLRVKKAPGLLQAIEIQSNPMEPAEIEDLQRTSKGLQKDFQRSPKTSKLFQKFPKISTALPPQATRKGWRPIAAMGSSCR